MVPLSIRWTSGFILAALTLPIIVDEAAAAPDDREIQLSRQRYRFTHLATQPAITGLKGNFAQALFIGARVTNGGAKPALSRMTVLVDVKFENRERVTTRAHLSVEGIASRKSAVVYFPAPLPSAIDANNLPEIKSVSLQVETSLSVDEKQAEFIEFGAEPSDGFYLASVDREHVRAKVYYATGREVYAGGRTGRIVRDKIALWSDAGSAVSDHQSSVSHGEPVRLLKKFDDWMLVRTFKGEQGYIPAMLISSEPDYKNRPTTIKARNYGTFRLVEYSIVSTQQKGTVVEGRMLNDTANFYYLTGFIVHLQDESGRKIGEGRAVIKEFGRKEVAPFAVVFDGLPSHRVARVRFRLADAELRNQPIIIRETNTQANPRRVLQDETEGDERRREVAELAATEVPVTTEVP